MTDLYNKESISTDDVNIEDLTSKYLQIKYLNTLANECFNNQNKQAKQELYNKYNNISKKREKLHLLKVKLNNLATIEAIDNKLLIFKKHIFKSERLVNELSNDILNSFINTINYSLNKYKFNANSSVIVNENEFWNSIINSVIDQNKNIKENDKIYKLLSETVDNLKKYYDNKIEFNRIQKENEKELINKRSKELNLFIHNIDNNLNEDINNLIDNILNNNN